MSDDLLEWLDCPCSSEVCLPRAAKARIEAQAAEIERLREALTKISLRKWNSMTQGCNAAREASNIARAALAGKAEH
jgi:hypothetical protein